MTNHTNNSYSNTQQKLQKQLIDAAKNSNIVEMKRLIKSGADPFKNNLNDKSALSIIIQNNLSELKKIILGLIQASIRGQK